MNPTLLTLALFCQPSVHSLDDPIPRDFAPSPLPGTASGDYDRDGDLDVYVAGAPGRLLRQGDDGTWLDVTADAGLDTAEASHDALLADVNADGWPDLLLLSPLHPPSLYRGGTSGTFTRSTAHALDEGGPASAATLHDPEGDGLPDLWLLGPQAIRLLRNLGNGEFDTALTQPVATGSPHGPGLAWLPEGRTDGDFTEEQAAVGEGSDDRWSRGTAPATLGVPVGPAAPNIRTSCLPSIADQALAGSCIQASSEPVPGMLYPIGSDWFVSPSGMIGVGTTTPMNRLHILGDVRSDAAGGFVDLNVYGYGNVPSVGLQADGADNKWLLQSWYPDGDGNSDLQIVSRATSTTGTGRVVIAGQGDDTVDLRVDGDLSTGGTIRSDAPGGFVDLNVYGYGNVPSVGLQADGADNKWIIQSWYPDGDGNSDLQIVSRATSTTGTGRVVIAGKNDDTVDLHVDGDVSTRSLEIRGGSDLVEGFDTGERALEPGTLVVIDPVRSGRLTESSSPYDAKVAGVISGAGGVAHGIRMGQEGVMDGEALVAMAGRVYAKCTDESGPIRPGDRLTSSSLAGHAMKAADALRADGTVVGKAMSSLESGTGLVLVLINLQ